MRAEADGGASLVEALLVVAAVALLVGLAASSLVRAARERSVETAAATLAARMRRLALQAALENRTRGLVFHQEGSGEPFRPAVDGDGDGLSREDVGAGRDPAAAPAPLARDHPGVTIGLPREWRPRELPPSEERLPEDASPLRFGRARIAAFSPRGDATPGSVFLTDGRGGVCALRVTGAGGRIRVYCYDRRRDGWRRR
jgi:type II secretory pathway pseudopilin PulG